jgi:hypothetical protein
MKGFDMRLNMRISEEDRATLEQEARRLGVSVSDVARMVLRTYLPEVVAAGKRPAPRFSIGQESEVSADAAHN